MSISLIPNLSDRRIATKVLSDFGNVVGPEGLGEVENIVTSAYGMLKNSGEAITELRLKEITTGIARGEIKPNQPTGGVDAGMGQTVDFSTGRLRTPSETSLSGNSELVQQGQGSANLGAPFGHARDNQVSDNFKQDAGFTESAADFAGTFAWNFTDSLLLGLPGLAYSKLKGESDNGFTDFIDGMKMVDTDAGKWGSGLGVAASFLGPGGLIKGTSLAARGVAKLNLVGKTFALGGQALRAGTGVTGAIKAIKTGVKVGDNIAEGAKVITQASKLDIVKAREARKVLKAKLKTAKGLRRRGLSPMTESATVESLQASIKSNKLTSRELHGRIKGIESLGKKDKAVREAISETTNDVASEFYNMRRKLSAKEINAIGADGMREGIKTKIISNSRHKIVSIVGDNALADDILKNVVGGMDEAIDGFVSGTKTWGETFGAKKWISAGVSDRVGKILQNGAEEAIGFASHSLLYGTITGLAEEEDIDLDSLGRILKDSGTDAAHSVVTAAVFATGGGIPFINSHGGIFAAPLKLFFPTKKATAGEAWKAMFGSYGASGEAYGHEIQKLLGNQIALKKEVAKYSRGLSGSGSFMSKLRNRKLIDFDRLAAEDPGLMAQIAKNLRNLEEHGHVNDLITAGVMTRRGTGLHGDLQKLQEELFLNNNKVVTDAGREAAKSLGRELTEQGERAMEMNWHNMTNALRHDIPRNTAIGASIFFGGGGNDMIKGMKEGDVHPSDVFTHFLFSMSSAMHGLHMLPGKAIGESNFDTKLHPPEEFLIDSQNKMVLRALGLDAGAPSVFNAASQHTKDPLAMEAPDERARELIDHTLDEVNLEEMARSAIKDKHDPTFNPETDATPLEARNFIQALRRLGVTEFDKESPMSVLNPYLAYDGEKLDLTAMSNIQADQIGMALGFGVAGAKKNIIASGHVAPGEERNFEFGHENVTQYMDKHTKARVNLMRDVVARGVKKVTDIMEIIESNSIGTFVFPEMKGVEQVGEVDPLVASAMLERMMMVSNSTGSTARVYDKSHHLTVEQAGEVMKALDEVNTDLKKHFNGVGLESPELTIAMRNYLKSGSASAGKSFMIDRNTRQSVLDGQSVGEVRFEDVIKMAKERGIVKDEGNLMVIADVDPKQLKEDGMDPVAIHELMTFTNLMRSTFGFNSRKGETLTRDQAERFTETTPTMLGKDEQVYDVNIPKFLRSVNIDLSNQVGMQFLERQLTASKASEVGADTFNTYRLFENLGIVFRDPNRGMVALRMSSDEAHKGKGNEEESILSVELLKASINSQTKEEFRLLKDTINKELEPTIQKLIDAGLLSGYASKGTFGQHNPMLDAVGMVDALMDIARGENFLRAENGKKSVLALLAELNRIDAHKPWADFKEYHKVRMLEGHIVKLLRGKNTSARDWFELNKIMEKYGVFGNKQENSHRLEAALEDLEDHMRMLDYGDSVIEQAASAKRVTDLGMYDELLGTIADPSVTTQVFFGEHLGIKDPDLQKQMLVDMKKMADFGLDSFLRLAREYESHAISIRPDVPLGEFTEKSKIALFNSIIESDSITRVTLGEFSERTAMVDGEIKNVSGTYRETNMAVKKGFLTQLRKEFGLDLFVLDDMIELQNTNYSLRKTHADTIERQKLDLYSTVREGNVKGLKETVDEKGVKSEYFEPVLGRSKSVLVDFGDMPYQIGFRMPKSRDETILLGGRLEKVLDAYSGNKEGGSFRKSVDQLRKFVDELKTGDSDSAVADMDNAEAAMRFIILHKLLGVKNMNGINEQITKKNGATILSRFKQKNGRAYTATNRQAWDRITEGDNIVGYEAGKLKGLVLSDDNVSQFHDVFGIAKVLQAGGVSWGDGQLFFHSSVLKAQAHLNGEKSAIVGVLKNSINHEFLDANGMNTGSFVTKNAGLSTPEMDKLLEERGLAFIGMSSVVKVGLNFKNLSNGALTDGTMEGRLHDEKGQDVSWVEAMNGEKVAGTEGQFEVDIESLKYNKMPHESLATVGYQTENNKNAEIIKDLQEFYFDEKIGEEGIVGMARKMFATNVTGRALQRAFVDRSLKNAKVSERVDLTEEMKGGSHGDNYLLASEYGAPSDLWFRNSLISTLKKSLLQDNLFKSKEGSGLQEILVAEYKGALNTQEAIASRASRNLTLFEDFAKDRDGGFWLAMKFEGEDAADRAHYDFADNFLETGKNDTNFFNNRDDYTSDNALKKGLSDGRYGMRRLYRHDVSDRPENGTFGRKKAQSLIVDALDHGMEQGKTNGIFKLLQNVPEAGRERLYSDINNFAIDLIEKNFSGTGGIKLFREYNERMPKEVVKHIMNGMAKATARNVDDAIYRKQAGAETMQTKFKHGHVSKGELEDAVGAVLGHYDYHSRDVRSETGKSDITWGTVGMNQRYPSTRIDDTMPLVFLGTLHSKMGNQVMVNYLDSTQKAEADYDIDNMNYWFRMPKSLLTRQLQMRNIQAPTTPPASYQEEVGAKNTVLNPLSVEHARRYAKSEHRSAGLRGSTVKANSVVEKMVKDQYQLNFTFNKESYRIKAKWASIEDAMATLEGREAMATGSQLTQEIIDSKKGILDPRFMDPDFDPMIEIAQKFYNIEIVEKHRRNEVQNKVVWTDAHKTMIRAMSQPYRDLLTFSKQSWVGDKSESMEFNAMRDITGAYRNIMASNSEQNISGIVKQYLEKSKTNHEDFSDISFVFQPTQNMAETAAGVISQLDSIMNFKESSILHGQEAIEVRELSQYLAVKNFNTGKDITDKDMADFIAQVDTKNWSVRKVGSQKFAVKKQLDFARQQVSNGNVRFTEKLAVLESQYKEVSSIESALRMADSKDPSVMKQFATQEEKNAAWQNTVSVQALQTLLSKGGESSYIVDPAILSMMENDARAIQGIRGKNWLFDKKETITTPEARATLGGKRQTEVDNAVRKYMEKWYNGASGYGSKSYNPNSAILALIIPQTQDSYAGTAGQQFVDYKKIPADLFNTAMDMAHDKGSSTYIKFLKDLGWANAVTQQYMNGSNGELELLKSMNRLAKEPQSMLAVATRISMSKQEMTSRVTALRDMGLDIEQLSNPDIEMWFGLNVSAMERLGKARPEDRMKELISIEMRQDISGRTVTDFLGNELDVLPLLKLEFNDARYESDSNGDFDPAAAEYLRRERLKNDDTTFQSQTKQKQEVIKRAEANMRNLMELINGSPNKTSGGVGVPAANGSGLDNIISDTLKRNERKLDLVEEGNCP